jgi:hypothetical protein
MKNKRNSFSMLQHRVNMYCDFLRGGKISEKEALDNIKKSYKEFKKCTKKHTTTDII